MCRPQHHAARRVVASFIVVACVGCGSATNDSSVAPAPVVESARELFVQGQHRRAFELAQDALITNPDDTQALWVVANVHANEGRFGEAAETAIALSQLGIPDPCGELLRAFHWHLRDGDAQAALEDLRHAVTVAPVDPRGHRALAQLLNSQGRRYEAHPHVLALARLGAISPRELLSLVDQGGPFQLVSFDEVLGESSHAAFMLGKARHQYIAEDNPTEALATVNQMLALLPSDPAAEAFRGRLIAETQDDGQFKRWAQQLPAGIDRYPEYWLAIGTWLSRHERDQQAVRALGEALRLDPTERRALRLLAASLSRLGERQKAQSAQATLAILDKVFRLASGADAQQAMWIGEQLQTLTRPWESIAWYRHALSLQGSIESHANELNDRAGKIRDWESGAGVDQIRDVRVQQMLGFNLHDFPLPEIDLNTIPRAVVQSSPPRESLMFHDVAKSVGVDTTFVSEYPLDEVNFYLHQANGGGLAALDYDLDGRCDLYVVQSGGDPNRQASSVPNQFFRQLPGDAFGEVSSLSGTSDRNYGQGVCAGDLNQDGMPDLLIANIGRNTVYVNQGDGTFREQNDLVNSDSDRWTSSIALGDLNGDQLPDVVEVNYLDDPLIFERKCEGRVLNCTPQRFRAASDRVFHSVGDGTFQLWDQAQDMDDLPNYGFGAVMANFDGQAGNDLFLSNDGDLNHFWRSVESPGGTQNRFALTECAGVAGCSIGISGTSQACMGIASGDFDRNGLLDIVVTNFHNEPVNLFLLNESGFFTDEALKYGLVESSTPMLGFGTQAADFDNDGWLDLAILNGHIYDARYADVPFRMVPQLLRGGRRAFSLQDAESAGAYWRREQLGRTLAWFDWNRDGRIDLVANHLDHPIAILQNDSAAENWVQLELVGVGSERDAIGARVTIHADGNQWTGWQTGGDGYMCTNEAVIPIGIGSAATIDRIEISWPSGNVQTLTAVKPNGRYLIVEGQDALQRR